MATPQHEAQKTSTRKDSIKHFTTVLDSMKRNVITFLREVVKDDKVSYKGVTCVCRFKVAIAWITGNIVA